MYIHRKHVRLCLDQCHNYQNNDSTSTILKDHILQNLNMFFLIAKLNFLSLFLWNILFKEYMRNSIEHCDYEHCEVKWRSKEVFEVNVGRVHSKRISIHLTYMNQYDVIISNFLTEMKRASMKIVPDLAISPSDYLPGLALLVFLSPMGPKRQNLFSHRFII